jgi:hypothetical protein
MSNISSIKLGLNKLGYYPSNDFSDKSTPAFKYYVGAFQLSNGLKVDFIFGEKSRRKMDSLLTDTTLNFLSTGEYYMPDRMEVDMYGELDNQQYVNQKLDNAMVLEWDRKKTISRVYCNARCAKDFVKALREINGYYGAVLVIKNGLNLYSGCYNKRPKRGGSSMSSHAWGMAFDINASGNPMNAKQSDTAIIKQNLIGFCNIMKDNNFRTLKHDLMHWQWLPHNERLK